MTTQKNVAFRSALNGYNREDVNRYILDADRQAQEREAALVREADSLREQTSSLEAECAAQKTRAAQADMERTGAENIIASLRESVDRLKEENAALREEIASLRRQTEEQAADANAEKTQKYDQISAQIGDIMIHATSSADRIVAQANEQAARILAETEEEAQYVHTRISQAADETLTQISALLHETTESCLGDLTLTLRELHEHTAALLAECGAKEREMSDRIAYYRSGSADSVSQTLTKMDEKYGIRPRSKSAAAQDA